MGKMKPAALLRQSKRQRGPARLSMTTVVACSVVSIMFLLSLAVLHKHKGSKHQLEAVADGWTDSLAKEGSPTDVQYAVLNTTKGLITLQLFGQLAPKAVKTFVNQSINGFYDGGVFYRAVKGEMIQAGGQGSNSSGGFADEALWKAGLNAEDSFPLTLLANPDAKGSQLFIASAGTQDLKNAKDLAVGSVVKGQEVVAEIENSATDSEARPLTPIVIHNIVIKDGT